MVTHQIIVGGEMNKVEASKEKIVEATVKIAMDKGFANTRTADIAKEAGVSEGLIFKYFPTKNHLFAMILNDNIQRLKNGVQEIIDDSGLSPTSKIISVINFHFKFFTIDRNIVQLIFGHSERRSMIDVESVFQQGVNPYVLLVTRILEEGIKKGEFKPLNPEVTALAIIGGMQVTIINNLFLKTKKDLESTKSELIKFILAAIKC